MKERENEVREIEHSPSNLILPNVLIRQPSRTLSVTSSKLIPRLTP